MKKRGSTFEYGRQRDEELMAAFLQLLCNERGVPLADLYSMAAHSPASRFWVSEERALEVVYSLRGKGTLRGMTPMKEKMYREIYRRVEALLASGEELTVKEAVYRVVESPAPEFYLTDLSARVIIYRIRRERRRRRDAGLTPFGNPLAGNAAVRNNTAIRNNASGREAAYGC